MGREYRVFATRFRGWWLVDIPHAGDPGGGPDVPRQRTDRPPDDRPGLGVELHTFDIAVGFQRRLALGASS